VANGNKLKNIQFDIEAKTIDSILRFLSILATLVFLYFFFINMQSSIDKLSSSVFISVVVFAAVVIATIFGSSLILRWGNAQVGVNNNLDFNQFNHGAGGANDIINDDNIMLTPNKLTAKLSELVNDCILSEINKKDGTLEGYITMESFVNGIFTKEQRSGEAGKTIDVCGEPMEKSLFYVTPSEKAVLGEDILSVATKMVTKQLSALPVVDSNNRMVGYINYRQVLHLLVDMVQKYK